MEKKNPKLAPEVSKYTFTPGQQVGVIRKGERYEIPCTYLRSTDRMHVCSDAAGREFRVWFCFVAPLADAEVSNQILDEAAARKQAEKKSA